jgi:hypothetical protein
VTRLQSLGSFTETKLFGDCREVTKMAEFHFCWSAKSLSAGGSKSFKSNLTL